MPFMKTIRLLTVGNSFSNDACFFLESIGESAGVRFEIGRASLGGCSLAKHWNLAQYAAKHPDFKPYTLREREGAPPLQAHLSDALAAAPWDFITFQQVSACSWRSATFEPYLCHLIRMARAQAPRARLALHQTWSYRSDSPFFPQQGLTPERMFERIRETYAHYAEIYGCLILPSGEAIQEARRAPGRTFEWPDPEFPYAEAEPPALPRQDHSFNCGWYWEIAGTAEGLPELRLDPNHLNARGRYLAGCVWFERLTGGDARAVAFAPPEVTAEDAVFLREIAHRVCGRYAPPC